MVRSLQPINTLPPLSLSPPPPPLLPEQQTCTDSRSFSHSLILTYSFFPPPLLPLLSAFHFFIPSSVFHHSQRISPLLLSPLSFPPLSSLTFSLSGGPNGEHVQQL